MYSKVLLFAACFCAYSQGAPQGSPTELRIVNGTDAALGEIPYIVSLRKYHAHFCAATILDETHILTACHCTVKSDVKYFTIQYGITNITQGEAAPNSIVVKKLTCHPNYTPSDGYINDVAVAELEEPLSFSDTVQPVTLPKPLNATPENAPALLSGWGSSHTDGLLMTHLQKVNIQVYTDDACETAHESTGPTNRQFHICAGIPEGGKGQCSGDSGGPLIVDGCQVGIVSWSVKPCTLKGYPGVFSKVSTHVDWIKEQMASSTKT